MRNFYANMTKTVKIILKANHAVKLYNPLLMVGWNIIYFLFYAVCKNNDIMRLFFNEIQCLLVLLSLSLESQIWRPSLFYLSWGCFWYLMKVKASVITKRKILLWKIWSLRIVRVYLVRSWAVVAHVIL